MHESSIESERHRLAVVEVIGRARLRGRTRPGRVVAGRLVDLVAVGVVFGVSHVFGRRRRRWCDGRGPGSDGRRRRKRRARVCCQGLSAAQVCSLKEL